MRKVAFVTNFCAYYRVKVFNALAKLVEVDFYFYSPGNEWYWQKEHGIQTGSFNCVYLPGFQIGRTRISPCLPLVLTRSKYQAFIKCINGKFALPITYFIARITGKPFILWTGVWMRLDTIFHRAFFLFTRHLYRHSDAIVVYGSHVRDFLVEEGVYPEKVFIAPNSVDNTYYRQQVPLAEQKKLRQSLAIHEIDKIILYLGRLDPGKGLLLLLEAFADLQYRHAFLVIAGRGSLEDNLKKETETLGIMDRVRFTGYVPVEETMRYYSIADVFVLPSVTTKTFKEPWGLVINEAMNQRLPVIASTAVGAAAGGLVQNGRNGLIIPEGEKKPLTNAMEEILRDPVLAKRMGNNAYKDVLGWNYDSMAGGFIQALEYVGIKGISG